MHLGKQLPKLTLSCSRPRIRLGVAHHGAPSAWTPQSKDERPRAKAVDKKRR
jgi:hypothetical protein